MNRIKLIRRHLGVTQKVFADAIGCVQASVVAYEHGRRFPQDLAAKLIQFAALRGCVLDFNHIYGDRPLPMWIAVAPEDAGTALAQEVGRQVRTELLAGVGAEAVTQEPAHG